MARGLALIVIAALEKYAFGVGFELAMACDFRLATKDTLVALPEINLGEMPGSGGSVRVGIAELETWNFYGQCST